MSLLLSRKKSELRSALASKDPYRTAEALELPSIDPKALGAFQSRGGGGGGNNAKSRGGNNTTECSLTVEGTEWGGVLGGWIDAAAAAEEGDAVQVFESQSSLHSSLNHIFGTSSGNWLVPALHAACRNTHRSAIVADHANAMSTSTSGGGGGKNDHARLQAAVTLLQESFSKTLNDRKEYRPDHPLNDSDGSKKAGVLLIVNHLFAMYFRLNTLRLCKNLLRPVETRGLHESGTQGEMVTYRYYVGRLSMFEDNYESAERHLDYALRHCHRNATRNKRRILNYLLPVMLLRGRLPTRRLLTKHSLREFEPLVEGIRTGDLRTFNDGLRRYQDLFIRRGTYLLLEKCKTVCYRNLFKRVYLVLGRSQLPLDHVAKSFKWLGMPIDLDEVECILANLIFRGYVRGYISHAKRVLVLSKKDPFPVGAVIAK